MVALGILTMKRLAPLSLFAIVLLAGLIPGHAAAQRLAESSPPAPEATATPAPERPYFAQITCSDPRNITRYGQPWRYTVVYGKYRDPAGLHVDGITIDLDSDTIDIDTTTQTNEDGGFYYQVEFPAYQWGTIWVRGFAPDGRITQPGECYIPEERTP